MAAMELVSFIEIGHEMSLEKIQKAIKDTELAAIGGPNGGQRAAPVEKWNPDYCGSLDILLKSDGSWHYQGSPIGRKPLVKLFASVLRKDADGETYLVTPAEKIKIRVEDAHFLGVELRVDGEGEGQKLTLRTQTDDWVALGRDNPLWFEPSKKGGLNVGELIPYCHMRGRLTCKLNWAVYYQLVDLASFYTLDDENWFGVFSNGTFFKMMLAKELEALEGEL